MQKRIIIPTMLILAGIAAILGIPSEHEGPLLLYINEQHSIRLADAVGLVLAVTSWLYLNLIMLRWLVRDRKYQKKRA